MSSVKKAAMNVVKLKNVYIFNQLKFEEAIFRNSTENWLITNYQSNCPSIVMGISGKPEKLINEDVAKQHNLEIVRRFSGGGTVVVDNGTYFCTIILNKADMPGITFPNHLMNWSGEFYKNIFNRLNPDIKFELKQNDYVIDDKKCAGNAQSFSNTRMIHHTSFLYEFDKELMKALKTPEKQPEYRLNRSHDDFLVPLKQYNVDMMNFYKEVETELSKNFDLNYHVDLEKIADCMDREHRKVTQKIEL